ncbi:uncharacterized protein JCM6883_004094 [Sporobolomyces salmoneus]|uniref:uncharacterized protein n=1 Tax=Sporobolomyces salmoneus TaxID=183962 RepID=UPI00317CE6D9
MCDCECGHHGWDDESTQGEIVYDVRDRKIHPLPKRKRFLDTDSARLPVLSSTGTGRITEMISGESESEEEDIGDVDERHTRSSATIRRQEPAREMRTSGEQEYGDGRSIYPPRKRTESPSSNRKPFRPDSPSSPSPSTTRTTTRHDQPSSPVSPRYYCQDEEEEEEPRDYGLFGEEGYKIAKSLENDASFSTAGLFEGWGLAGIHAGAGTGTDDRHYVEEEEEEDGDEDTYGVVDRSRPPVEPTHESTIAATALGTGVGGSNKKKRKIPGLTATSLQPESNGTELPPTPSSIPPTQSRTRAREEDDASPSRNHGHSSQRHDQANEWLPMRAPVNPPTTAKAALAKLRIRPPHISLCSYCFTARRHRRKRFKYNCTKQSPLPLPSAPNFVPPAMPREGPPKLPPGSGLKGSKALKAAAKLAKEKEKEKEKIRKLFGGIKLPDLFDPEGKRNPATWIISRLIAREIEKKKQELRVTRRISQESPNKSPSGYPTPPASSDDGEDEHSFPWAFESSPPELDSFDFEHAPPEVIDMRWKHLRDQKERVKAAKERAAKAREEEKQRRREKEERDRAEKAAAVAVPSTPAPTPQRKSHPPSSSHNHHHHAPPPSAPPSNLPPAPPPASALPSPPHTQSPLPPPRKAPPKKGRKKRSALANAHNVHHRDNYVPSRLPAAPSQAQHHHNSQSNDPSFGPSSWPASEAAIASAGSYASTCGGGHYCDPDEWLCLFCEYQLFYGEEPALYRAVRKRKGVLKVRQKAKDRAQKATQGKSSSTPSPVSPEVSKAGAAREGSEEGGGRGAEDDREEEEAV